MEVIKISGKTQPFNVEKIYRAIRLANKSVPEESRMSDATIDKVVNNVVKMLDGFTSVSVDDIHDLVERALMKFPSHYQVAKEYITYRDQKKKNKKFTEIEEQVLAVIDGSSTLRGDNANKKIDTNSALRDYIAGITCKSISKKVLPKKILNAHNKGLIHWHDMDYSPTQPLHNCFLGSQKFITADGIKSFNEYRDGETVFVRDAFNVIRKATVHMYGKQPINKVIFTTNGRNNIPVFCTPTHTWILKDGTKTTDLKVGDVLMLNNNFTEEAIEDEYDAKIWCLGFMLGDGWDQGAYCRIRLCGQKNKYLNNFIKAGCFTLTNNENSDNFGYTKQFSKQDFINSKGWKYLSPRHKALLFQGYYAADARKCCNDIYTSDERMCEFIEECAGIAGYYIIRKKYLIRNTNYKKNATGYSYAFLKPQKSGWKVKSIEKYRGGELKNVYCINEPVTHSFMLEYGIPTGNCDLLNVEDMFKNGFQMGDTRIEPNEDTPFETACNLLAQINLQVSGSQYGGQTVSWSHLLPFIENSRRLIRKNIIEDYWDSDRGKQLSKINKMLGTSFKPYTENDINKLVEKKLRAEIYKGVKTYQYQVLCHQSSNGQTPFVSNNLCLREAQTEQELKDFAMLIEEILKRRIKGVKDSSGHYVSPLFPKLLYWTCDGLNVKRTDPYYYLTELAAECELKRTQPDIVSEKETRRVKKGQIIPSMGCRSLLGPIWEEHTYPIDTKFYWEEGTGINNFDINTTDVNTFNLLAFNYSNFVEARSFEELENNDNILIGKYRINFRGNTGWLISKNDKEVTILEPKVYGRWNNGVITINIPHIALEARSEIMERGMNEKREFTKEDFINKFYQLFEERLQLVREGLIIRNNHCKTIKAKNSPILWMHGGLSRMESEQTVGDLMDLYPQRPTISFGFVGLYETCEALINESNTTDNGRKLSIEILQFMNDKCNEWKKIDKVNYAIYGTPEESLTYKFALANRRDFGLIEHITDKDYVVNSYHVDPREEIDAFSKIEIEGEYLALSSGGAVSYVELMDHSYNKEAIISIIQWMHEHIVYAEFNKKLAVCHVCGHEGGINLIKTDDGEFKFICPKCGNTDDSKMNIVARICGYLGQVNAGNTNKGRLDDIYHRVIHTDCKNEF